MYTSVTEKQQVLMLFLLEIVLIALIGTFMTYGPEANANLLKNHTGQYTIHTHICIYVHKYAHEYQLCNNMICIVKNY